MEKIKVVLLGPREGGKTILANFISNVPFYSRYTPTNPCRILEIERDLPNGNHSQSIELWDMGGEPHPSYQSAITDEADAYIFVFNPEIEGQAKQLDDIYTTILHDTTHQLKPSLLLGFSWERINANESYAAPTKLAKTHQGPVPILTKNCTQEFSTHFDSLIESIIQSQEKLASDEF